MAHSILARLALGYQPLWNQLRQLCGIQLFVDVPGPATIDAGELVALLNDIWPKQAPALIVSVRTPELLSGLLEQAAPDGVWVEVAESLLVTPEMVRRVHQAHQRGLRLVWRGASGTRPKSAMGAWFHKFMFSLTTEETLTSLRVSLKKHQGDGASPRSKLSSPVLPGQIYEAIASQVLTEHCLDEQAAWSVAGWPMEDVLHSYRHKLIQPSHRAVVRLVEAIDADESMESIEHILNEEPLVAYRFLRFANSAALGLRTGIDSIRLGLTVLGYATLKQWLLEQLPHATSDLNLQPIRTAMVVRARLMANLLDAEDGDYLHRDLYLCGLLSQIDLLLGESSALALQRLPLSEPIKAAILAGTGPHMPYLDIASALESANTSATASACETHGFTLQEVNAALLRTLSIAQAHPARGLLLV